MKWSNFENNIKKELSGQRPEIDTNALWGLIEQDVDAINYQKKKRRGGFFWLFFGGLLIAGAGLGYYYLNQNDFGNNIIVEQETIIENEDLATNLSLVGDETREIDKKEIATVSTKNELTPKTLAGKGFNENGKNAKPAKKNVFQKSAIAKTPSLNKNETEEAAPKIVVQKTQASESLAIADLITEKKEAASVIETEENTTTEAIKIEADDLVKATSAKEQIPEANQEDQKDLLSTIIDSKEEQEVTLNSKDKEENPNESNAENPFQFYVNLQGGVSFSSRNLEATDPSFDTLLQLREGSENQLETSSIGLQIGLAHQSGLELTTGINYTQINERYSYNEIVTETDSIYGVEKLVKNLENGFDTIWGNVPLDRITTLNKEIFNRFKMYEVPILLGYRISKGKYRIGVQAGVFANLQMKTEGRVLENTKEDIDVTEAGIYKSKVGLSYYAGLSFGYLLNENLEIYAAPSARFFPKNFAVDSYGLSQKYKLYGLNLGMRYSF